MAVTVSYALNLVKVLTLLMGPATDDADVTGVEHADADRRSSRLHRRRL